MKIRNEFFILFGVFYLLFSLYSCEKSTTKNIKEILLPNDSIIGLAFTNESSSSFKYSPKGNFIQVIKPDNGIWKSLILEQNNLEIIPKVFFFNDDEPASFLYDNLNHGIYQIKYISDLKDTISETLNFEKNIELKFPEKLNKYYEELVIEDFDLKKFNKEDTLQLLYQNYGCFGSSETLVEFTLINKSLMNLRKRIVGLTPVGVPENQWLYPNKTVKRKKLIDFISKAKKIKKSQLDLCTSDMNYIFRIKGTNIVSIIEDKSCELPEEIERLIN